MMADEVGECNLDFCFPTHVIFGKTVSPVGKKVGLTLTIDTAMH